MRTLLERYVEAKDFNRPDVATRLFRRDVVLTYSIATDAIAFPARTSGFDAVVRVLIADFATRYTRCRTYYIEDLLREDGEVLHVPWLVVMREDEARALRIGRGWYRWTFASEEDQRRVCALHIHIERMDPMPDREAGLLSRIQAVLPYPWLRSATLYDAMQRLSRDPGFGFIDAFGVAVRLPPPAQS
ncbi:MAG TPA: hypothetical protein VFB54_13515 [Burkholderiales bacterium]|nr:hypothetical protein [Burkholderiales bacterium]